MKHILTLAALVFATSCFGQEASWQAEDLLLYMDFDGNYVNLVPGENQLEMQGVPIFASDSSRASLELDGNGEHLFHPNPTFPQGEEFSLCLEFRLDEFGSGGGPDQIPIVSKWQSSGTPNNEFYLLERDGFLDFVLNNEAHVSYSHNWDVGSWHTACFQVADTCALWVDGEFFWSALTSFGQSSFLFRVGDWYSTQNTNYRTMDGALSKLVAWSAKLPSGAHQFFTQDADIAIGCTDPSACNYSEGNVLDDDNCYYECEFCQNGTIWDNELGACVAMFLAENACLEGTVWSEELGGCVVANPSDTDFDGCVSMTDLLDLLSVFGTCNEIPWSCGDPLEYQGYDYETVQIGWQCWFAENLRVTSYRNGEGVDSYQDPANWASASNGGMCTYGNSSSNDGVFGLLYNWYAVDDARGLCPSGWSVPTDGEWMTMEMSLGMSEAQANGTSWRGTNQGSQMKMTYGWNNGGNGTNSSGFSGLPGGYRESNGNFSGAGYNGNWWSSSSDGANAWHRFLFYDAEAVNRGVHNYRRGVSVRCIQDSE